MATCYVICRTSVTTDSAKEGRSLILSLLSSLTMVDLLLPLGQENLCNYFPANFGNVGKNISYSFPNETAHFSHLLNQTSCRLAFQFLQPQARKAAKPTVQLSPSIFWANSDQLHSSLTLVRTATTAACCCDHFCLGALRYVAAVEDKHAGCEGFS